MKYLLIIDVQKDFVDGALGSEEAKKVVPSIIEKAKSFDGEIIFTRDTHSDNYMNTQEGKNLPVPHCIENSDGWQLIDELEEIRLNVNAPVFNKPTFGSVELIHYLTMINEKEPIEEIEIIGLDTDICVISNALCLKAAIPELPIYVDPRCCAGSSIEAHNKAIDVMKICQVYTRGE